MMLLSALCAAGLSVLCDAVHLRLAASEANTPPMAKKCPGTPVCHGRGDCDIKTGLCWCEAGWGGRGCEEETPLFVEVVHINAPELQDMLGKYRADGMYLYEVRDAAGKGLDPSPDQVKWIHYDHASSGWAISKFNSSCIDDTCFFAYAPMATQGKAPPPSGYVYGGPILHVYYKQMMFDDADLDPAFKRGFHFTVSYTPDPKVQGAYELNDYNGRYTLQPRYTHIKNKKYAIMPINLKVPQKQWVATGLLGKPRKRKVIVSAVDPSENRYTPPRGPWVPEELEFEVRPACENHVGNLACTHVEPMCLMDDSDGVWARQCCRDTCNSCHISRSACPLPKTDNLAEMLQRLKSKTSALPNATSFL